MKFFLDTANLAEIRSGAEFGVIDGVTTNPTLVAKEGRPFRELILAICDILPKGVINAEVVSTDTAGMLREGRELASWHPNIAVKIPMTSDGVRALHVLEVRGVLTQPKVRYDFPRAASTTLPRAISEHLSKQQKAIGNIALSRA